MLTASKTLLKVLLMPVYFLVVVQLCAQGNAVIDEKVIKHVLIYDDPDFVESQYISNIDRHSSDSGISYVGFGRLLNAQALSEQISPFIGKSFSVENANALEFELEKFFSEIGTPLDVVVPDQSRSQEYLRLLIVGVAMPSISESVEGFLEGTSDYVSRDPVPVMLPELRAPDLSQYSQPPVTVPPPLPVPVAQTPVPPPPARNVVPPPPAPVKESKPAPKREVPNINGIVLVGDPTFLNNYGKPPSAREVFKTVGIKSVPSRGELMEVLNPFLGKKLEMDELAEMKKSIIRHYQNNDRPVVNATIPRQPIGSGIVQIVMNEGSISDVVVQGNEHFTDGSILESLELTKRGYINPEVMDKSIRHLNQNPFINVDAKYEPGQKRGETDLVINVKDRFPMRISAGVDNYGNKLTGSERFFAGINFGNLYGPNRMLNYQFTSDLDFDLLFSHSLSYTELLPWNHTFTAYGGYSEAESIFDDPTLTQEGTSISVGMLYSIPLPDLFKVYRHNIKVGADIKQSNSSLFFNQLDISNQLTDTIQFSFGYDAVVQDPLGVTSLGLTAYGAPGDWTRHSKQRVYTAAGYGDSQYFYGKLNLTRSTRLPADWSWLLRISGQYTSSKLPSGETMGVGGSSTVRGYDEREANGDLGLFVSNEIRTASYALPWGTGNLQLLTFVDAANVQADKSDLNANNPNIDLLSAGVGLRYALQDYAVLNVDYGWQLKDTAVSTLTRDGASSRGHIYFNMSY